LSPTVVLVSSPDEGLRAQVRLTLGDDRFAITEAADTDDAIRAVAAEVPALAILDAQLPGAGALAFARTLRGQPETAEVRTLLLVQRGEDAPAGEGVDATMAVPMTSFALLRRVGSLLEGDGGGAAPAEPTTPPASPLTPRVGRRTPTADPRPVRPRRGRTPRST
jgi:DNA-binding response OmpR family regulator